MLTESEYDKKVNTVKGLYISALVFACISLLGKILYVVTGDRDSMAKLESRLLSAIIFNLVLLALFKLVLMVV